MKKLVVAAAIMMLVPFSAFALDSMNDDALDKMTAQEGVTIVFSNVVISQSAADVAWSDSDGVGGTTTGGTVYVEQTGDTTTTITRALEIDVATAGTGGYAVAGSGGVTIAEDVSFVKIGLPDVNQSTGVAGKTMTISLSDTLSAGSVLGTFFQAGGTTSIAPNSAVYILAH